MTSGREQFLYGAIVGAGAVALGAGAILATSGLCRKARSHQHDHGGGGHHHHGGHGFDGHDHEHEGWGNDHLFTTFLTGQYAPPEEQAMYPFTPKDLLQFHRKVADVCIKHKQVDRESVASYNPMAFLSPQEGVVSRAMEVGCATGRTVFELSRGFDYVLGVDISQAFVDKCNEIKRTGQTEYWMPGEGELGETKIAKLPPEIVSFSHFPSPILTLPPY